MKYNLSIAFVLLTSTQSKRTAYASVTQSNRRKLGFLLGDWIDEISGELGKGGIFSFRYDLNQNLLKKKLPNNRSLLKDETLADHKDLLVVYMDTSGDPVEAIYYDNTGMPFKYRAIVTENKVIFENELGMNAPRFRLRYARISDNSVNIKFDIAAPQSEVFETCLEGNAYRRADQN